MGQRQMQHGDDDDDDDDAARNVLQIQWQLAKVERGRIHYKNCNLKLYIG